MDKPILDPPQDPWDAFQADLRRIAGSPATVLIEGEGGAGKSRAAIELHRRGPSPEGPLVVVDLGALPPTLVEGELFGHEEGAFTGATHARLGRFRRAHGGTIVLEGIDRLPADIQGKLLRVLQEREVEPLGSEQPVPVDVRVLATSASDLASDVERGTFREDLFFRLAVVRLRVPPLRARGEGILALAEQLLDEVGSRLGLSGRELGDGARERLIAHPWPGNVRELENALERVIVLGGSDPGKGPITADELAFLEEPLEGAADRIAGEVLSHGVSLEELDFAVLRRALDEARGNLSAAARSLGLSRRAFEYRWKKVAGASGDDDSP